ncbi:hypothetical protein NJT12_04965 [Flavobacterium sp. AC]|uniref:Uncharacterized protein n=1 Tax=Flavobacterium azizsancarii TaxID=2961580 RepID=A0ABT4W8V2_9FLAO|nr:hypothetical protein [Flavobacterium azizsancarii]MDA6068968.1 hypothetical protein [Flavobacterium azizsancarii]
MAIVRTAEIVINSNASQAQSGIDNLDNSVDNLSQSTNNLATSTNNNRTSLISSNQAMSAADKLTGGFASQIQSAAQSTGLLSAAQKAMTIATGAGTSAMQIFKIALASTGIGLIVIAVGLLIAYLVKLNPVMDIVEQGMAAIGAVINTVQQALASLFSGDLSGFANLGDDMDKAAQAAIELTKTLQDLDDIMKEQDVTNAKFKNQYDELILQTKNRTLSEQERINMFKKADELEKANYAQRKTIANQVEQAARQAIINEANLTKAEATELMKRGINYKAYAEGRLQNADELFDKLAEAQKANLAIENESISMRTKSQNKQDALAEKQEADRQKRLQDAHDKADKARQKREADEEKARQIREANDKAYNDSRIKLIRDIEDLEDTTEEKKIARRKSRDIEAIKGLKGKSEEEKKILLDSLDQKYLLEAQNANNKTFLDLEKKLQDDLRNLRRTSDQQKLDDRKKADLDAINALKGRTEAEITQLRKELDDKYAIEQAALDKKKQKEINDALEKASLVKTYEDAKTLEQVQAIEARSLAVLEAERIAAEALLIQNGATEEQLAQLNAGYREKANQERQKANERQAQLEQVKYDFTKKMATDGINLVDSLERIGIVKGKAAAKAKKILTLTQIGADTASAISSLVAYSNSAGAAAGPAGLAVSIATYAAGGLQILGNIAKAKKLLSAGDGGGDSGGGGSTVPAMASAPPNVAFQPSQQSQLANTINSTQSTVPIKVYTVSKDMTSAQELDRNINESAKF